MGDTKENKKKKLRSLKKVKGKEVPFQHLTEKPSYHVYKKHFKKFEEEIARSKGKEKVRVKKDIEAKRADLIKEADARLIKSLRRLGTAGVLTFLGVQAAQSIVNAIRKRRREKKSGGQGR